jgi:hypothetical protein
MASTAYSPLDAHADDEMAQSELDSFLEHLSGLDQKLQSNQSWLRRPWAVVAAWILAAFFAAASLVLLLEIRLLNTTLGTYETGFDTDMLPPSSIPLERIRFTRSPRFLANGTGYLDPVDTAGTVWPENMVLFGPPSPAIDDNWRRLIGHRYFAVSEDEAARAWGERRHEYVDEYAGGYTAG